VPPSRHLRRLYGVDPPIKSYPVVSRFSTHNSTINSSKCPTVNFAPIPRELAQTYAPDGRQRCFCALSRHEAYKHMHIRVCTASCRARRSESRGSGRDKRAGLKVRKHKFWRFSWGVKRGFGIYSVNRRSPIQITVKVNLRPPRLDSEIRATPATDFGRFRTSRVSVWGHCTHTTCV